MSFKLISSFTFSFLASILFSTQAALALPLGTPGGAVQDSEFTEFQTFADWNVLAVDFTAIVALDNCSGSLVRLESSFGTDAALVLTNGHCFEGGFIDPGKAVVNQSSNRAFSLLSSDGKTTLARFRAEKVLYATMTKTDMALYRLTTTYDQIESAYGVKALTISSRHPEETRSITIPSGYWRRLYNCKIDGFVFKMKEDKWSWEDSIRYSSTGCETIGGTSGSPIIDTETYEVVGVNNTGNESGKTCTMNNPCEIDENGNVTVKKKTSYGQQTFWIYGCLTADNALDLKKEGCELPN